MSSASPRDPFQLGLRLGAASAIAVWFTGGIVLGVRWGRSLRYGGDRLDHQGPILDAVINFLFVMLPFAAFVGVLVFAGCAWWGERRSPR